MKAKLGARWGIVSKYNETRAFGYIREHANSSPSGRATEQFFHLNNVNGRVILKVDDSVSFDVVPSAHKAAKEEAVNVSLFLRMADEDAMDADGNVWCTESLTLYRGQSGTPVEEGTTRVSPAVDPTDNGGGK